jgi:hypothetical protein
VIVSRVTPETGSVLNVTVGWGGTIADPVPK